MGRGRIPLEVLAGLPSFTAVTPSWSGEKIAFYGDKTGRFELYVMDLKSRTVEQMTDGTAPRGIRAGFVWTRDDAAIIFAKDRDGDEQNNLFRLDLATKTVTQLNDDPRTQEYAVQVTPDNRAVTVNSNREGQMNLFTFDMETRSWRRLTNFQAPAQGVKWDPTGQWLACGSNESRNLMNQDGYLVRHDGGEVRKVLSVKEGSRDSISDWHPDGRRLAVSSDAEGASRPGILDLESGAIRWFGRPGVDEYAAGFSRNGRWLAAVRNHESSMMPVLYEVETGAERLLKLPPGFAYGSSFVLDDTKLLVQLTSATRRAELVLYDLKQDTYEVLLPAEYGSIDPALFVADEHIYYPASDGKQVPAILYKPRDARPGARLPAVVAVHGGPTAQWFRGFDIYAQFLCDLGYVVLEPNVRGSTGYGVAWRDANRLDWGGGDLEDVAAGADYLRTLDYVDPERIGVFGGSYGGFMSFLAVGKKPDHFKVGVPIVGISDLQALYNESMEHFKYYLRQQMGDPAEHEALWRDRSAVTHVPQIKAKMLIIHGMNDPRCPISQARIFRDALLAAGKVEGADFAYHEFADQGHGPSGDIEQKIRNYRLLGDFLERHL